jgi:hypothetical protein
MQTCGDCSSFRVMGMHSTHLVPYGICWRSVEALDENKDPNSEIFFMLETMESYRCPYKCRGEELT